MVIKLNPFDFRSFRTGAIRNWIWNIEFAFVIREFDYLFLIEIETCMRGRWAPHSLHAFGCQINRLHSEIDFLNEKATMWSRSNGRRKKYGIDAPNSLECDWMPSTAQPLVERGKCQSNNARSQGNRVFRLEIGFACDAISSFSFAQVEQLSKIRILMVTPPSASSSMMSKAAQPQSQTKNISSTKPSSSDAAEAKLE